ncbi:hypothetical protein AB0L04_26465, partial [Streptomyces glaucescens]
MVTFAQAQERAEEWINGDVPSYQHREVRVREFELGFVVWAEDREDGPRSDGGAQRLVIARDSGEATLWPSLPVGEVIRRYEEEYGREVAEDPVPAPAARVDLNQTSFLLTPPEWLQDAADRLGIPDQRESRGGASRDVSPGDAGSPGAGPRDAVSGPGGPADAVPGPAAAAAGPALPETQAGIPAGAAGASGPSGASASSGAAGPSGGPGAVGSAAPGGPSGAAPGAVPGGAPDVPVGATPWAGTDTNADAGEDRSVPLPETVFAPPLSGVDDEVPPAVVPEAKTELLQGGSRLPPTAIAPALSDPGAPGAPGGQGAAAAPGVPAPGVPAAPGAPGTPPPPSVPPVPGAPVPGAPQGSAPPPPPAPPGSTPPPVPGAPSHGHPQAGGAQPAPPQPGDIADAATSKAAPPPRRGR